MIILLHILILCAVLMLFFYTAYVLIKFTMFCCYVLDEVLSYLKINWWRWIMFYLKHKDTNKYFNYDEDGNILWVEDNSDASWWTRECDALFVQNLWNDTDTSYGECLWVITFVVEE